MHSRCCNCFTDPLAIMWPASGGSSPAHHPSRLPEAWPIAALRCDKPSPGHKGRPASPSAALNQSKQSPQLATRRSPLPPGKAAAHNCYSPSSCMNPKSLTKRGGRGERRGGDGDLAKINVPSGMCIEPSIDKSIDPLVHSRVPFCLYVSSRE